MAKSLYTELSKKNPYYISKHRYLELKHFCLQYNEWKHKYLYLQLQLSSRYGIAVVPAKDNLPSDIVGQIASEMAELRRKIELVESVSESTDEVLGKYILEAVTSAKPYEYFQTMYDIPCCRDTFYNYYRKYFYLLDRRWLIMTKDLYDDIIFWLDGGIIEDERKMLIDSIYSSSEEKIRDTINRLTYNHLGIERV